MFLRTLATLLALTLTTHATASDSLRIVTSIKPLTLLTRAIAPPGTEVTTLVPAGASPHTYQLRPSDRRALAEADLILWVGPQMETFLERLLSSPDLAPKVLALMPPEDAQPGHTASHKAAPDEHEEHHEHEHGGIDPHVWLDPDLALTMTQTLRDRLIQLDSPEAELIATQFDAFQTALEKREGDIRQSLKRLHNVAIFTYHDAFRRFARHYGLTISDALTLTPERSPGARHIQVVQDKLRQANHPCLLTEPQFNRNWWQGLADETDLRISTWDPLASAVPDQADGYLLFQQSLADAVLECLPEQAEH